MNKKIANLILQIFAVFWILVSIALLVLLLYSEKNLSIFIQAMISLILSLALFFYIRYWRAK